ncbi:MAG: accessory factor UbiK family protein [Proteobacteria bacterium]|nr:accessory factor UbiK family protein [Pseudomonadota bacterium]
MQTDNPILDDLSKLANGLVATLDSVRKECDAMVRARIERLASEFDLVPRDEFEVLKEMLLKMKAENQDLKKRLGKLEKSSAKSRAKAKK